MDCPRCAAPMEEHTYEAHNGRAVVLDVCFPCQSFWFDSRESLALTPASTLALFRTISEHAGKPTATAAGLLKCPRCHGRLRLTKDLQRHTRFEYLKCPNGHGRLTTFLEFLKEKDFVRALTAHQIAELGQNVQFVNCSNCGAPVDLAKGSACAHCGSPLSMLDMGQAERLIAQLQAADKSGRPVDPALPLELERARRQTEASFAGLVQDVSFARDLSSGGLVFAGLHAVVRWLKPPGVS
ncbi:MAG: zf-TFIIB domain-containing protein [Acidobacteriota bacterium]|nr:zf-TFIIB domain-containing protein [Acidobacteriota bacterium]